MTKAGTNISIQPCDYSCLSQRQAVGSLINAYSKDEMGGGSPLSAQEQVALTDGLSKHPTAIVLLAETDGIYAGLLVAFENFSTFTARPMLNIHDVFVLPGYRGKGIGRLLLNAIIAEAAVRKASRLTLEVRTDNLPAQHLYQSLGFEAPTPGMHYWRKYLK
ncbi:MAG: GNAT family N-acetyltransferase [Tannerellaceae bacterium]|jgi:GNAT superfamily N-acetyltransferase|nr:GNAT family N-acetyltransferase [Tannerellaceae bacterium]